MPVALETPRHAVGLGMVNNRHMIDLPVAARATDSAVHVRCVIVINVVRRPMQVDPLDWLSRLPTLPDRFEFRVLLLHLRVTRHTGLGAGKIRMRGYVDKTMTISAVHPELRNMKIMRKRHWLDWLIPDAGIFRRDVIPRARCQAADNDNATNRDF